MNFYGYCFAARILCVKVNYCNRAEKLNLFKITELGVPSMEYFVEINGFWAMSLCVSDQIRPILPGEYGKHQQSIIWSFFLEVTKIRFEDTLEYRCEKVSLADAKPLTFWICAQ